jgi:hypothetical protein
MVKAMVRAEERATSSVTRKVALLAAVAAVGLGLALVVLVEGGQEIDPDQAWFWSPEWLAGEVEADAQIAAGQGIVHDSDEAFTASLKARLNPE